MCKQTCEHASADTTQARTHAHINSCVRMHAKMRVQAQRPHRTRACAQASAGTRTHSHSLNHWLARSLARSRTHAHSHAHTLITHAHTHAHTHSHTRMPAWCTRALGRRSVCRGHQWTTPSCSSCSNRAAPLMALPTACSPLPPCVCACVHARAHARVRMFSHTHAG